MVCVPVKVAVAVGVSDGSSATIAEGAEGLAPRVAAATSGTASTTPTTTGRNRGPKTRVSSLKLNWLIVCVFPFYVVCSNQARRNEAKSSLCAPLYKCASCFLEAQD